MSCFRDDGSLDLERTATALRERLPRTYMRVGLRIGCMDPEAIEIRCEDCFPQLVVVTCGHDGDGGDGMDAGFYADATAGGEPDAFARFADPQELASWVLRHLP